MTATILLVDADLIDRADWQALLQFHGYKVVTAGNGKAALEECPRIQPDLVLLDIGLNDIPGFEVFRRLQEDPRNVQTPIILMGPYSFANKSKERIVKGAEGSWTHATSRSEALSRVQSILNSKSHIGGQAEAVVLALAKTIEAKDAYTNGHSERIAEHAMKLGSRLGLRTEDIEALRIGGLIHDIGKVTVPDSILLKPGPLTSEESRIMREHPIVGEQICAPLKVLRGVLPIIRHHHERMDGTGYPDHLKGKDIPLNARIISVIDIYDSLTTDRPYRKALSPQRAKEILFEEAERGWRDTYLVKCFIDLLDGVRESEGRSPQRNKNLVSK
jgi:putative two-component system response regulator